MFRYQVDLGHKSATQILGQALPSTLPARPCSRVAYSQVRCRLSSSRDPLGVHYRVQDAEKMPMQSVCRAAAVEADTAARQPATGGANPFVEPPKGLRAIIIGTGMAGLAAARILADTFNEVVMLERDGLAFLDQDKVEGRGDDSSVASYLPDMQSVMSARRGVPQFQQPHVLLGRGLQELEELFPGFMEDLEGAGAVPLAVPKDIHQYDNRYGVVPHSHESLTFYGATRALVETLVRFKFMEQKRTNVVLRSGSLVTGLTFNQSGRAVTGVTLADGTTIAGDLVVDASGRGSKAPEWLAAAGYQVPEVQVVNCETRYATATYQLDPDFLAKEHPKRAWSVSQFYPHTRSALVLPVEGKETFQMILSTKQGDTVELTDEAVLEYMETLPDPKLAEVMRHAKRITKLTSYSRTENFRKLYEKQDLPDGVVMLGDSACAFNPVYGQGMTVGILQARALGAAVSEALGGVSAPSDSAESLLDQRRAALAGVGRKQMKQLGSVLRFPWAVATGTDAPFLPDFKQGPVEAFISRYLDELVLLSSKDAGVYDEVVAVMHMKKNDTVLLAPQLALRVLAFVVNKRWQQLMGRRLMTDTAVQAQA